VTARTDVAISPAGRLAGRTISAALLLTGAAFLVAAWPDLWRRCPFRTGPCVQRAAVAGIATMGAIIVLGVGAVIWWNVRRRPLAERGVSGYRWGLAVLFVGGVAITAKLIPAWSCAAGHVDPALGLCVTGHHRTDATSLMPLKVGLLAVGVVGAAAIGRLRGWVRVSALVAAVAWIAGTGWLLDAIFVR
jgi:hypothetical protein